MVRLLVTFKTPVAVSAMIYAGSKPRSVLVSASSMLLDWGEVAPDEDGLIGVTVKAFVKADDPKAELVNVLQPGAKMRVNPKHFASRQEIDTP
jgi:hypothetical protein